MKYYLITLLMLFSLNLIQAKTEISGELKLWHTITLTFDGPETSEYDKKNPFLDYRLIVTFVNGNEKFEIPGFYAADGNAGETSAEKGNKWRVHFTPNKQGSWKWKASFRSGKNIAISDSRQDGVRLLFDGEEGEFFVSKTDKSGDDFRSKGRLEYVGDRYLRFAGSGEYFLKGGAGSPENFLAYADFDGTECLRTEQREGEAVSVELKTYSDHIMDWKPGDPVWHTSKGKGIIGALNYLASKKINSVYFLVMNVQGDGNDVWPWINENERTRFDCSKLDQWEIVFQHMQNLGIMMHIITQETENELLLDIGQTQTLRKLYYRELAARFGHHLAITWNLGEENGPAHWTPKGQSDGDRKEMAKYLKNIIPYNNFITLHTHADEHHQELYLTPQLGNMNLDGPSLQIAKPINVNRITDFWIEQSKKSGKQWVVSLDEIGHHAKGALPDLVDPEHDTMRTYVLWGNLMAGGAGVEWYFGYKFAHNDLNCQDWRSRDILWDQTRYAKEFFEQYLPFHKMHSANNLISAKESFCFAKEGEIYAVYLTKSENAIIDLKDYNHDFVIKWYNPRTGGKLLDGSIQSVTGGGKVDIGKSLTDTNKDWVVLLRRKK